MATKRLKQLLKLGQADTMGGVDLFFEVGLIHLGAEPSKSDRMICIVMGRW